MEGAAERLKENLPGFSGKKSRWPTWKKFAKAKLGAYGYSNVLTGAEALDDIGMNKRRKCYFLLYEALREPMLILSN